MWRLLWLAEVWIVLSPRGSIHWLATPASQADRQTGSCSTSPILSLLRLTGN
jgi:hypothetical protein